MIERKFDSKHEEAFALWAEMISGIRVAYGEGRERFVLAEEVKYRARIYSKAGNPLGAKTKKWLNAITYTPDFVLWIEVDTLNHINQVLYDIPKKTEQIWLPHAVGWKDRLIGDPTREYCVCIDVKGSRTFHEERRFRHIQARMLELHGIYVNKVHVRPLCAATFFPKHELFMKKNGLPRKGIDARRCGLAGLDRYLREYYPETFRVDYESLALKMTSGEE